MAQSKGLPFVVTLNEKEGLPQSTDQKKEIQGENSKALVYAYAFEIVFLKSYGQGKVGPHCLYLILNGKRHGRSF